MWKKLWLLGDLKNIFRNYSNTIDTKYQVSLAVLGSPNKLFFGSKGEVIGIIAKSLDTHIEQGWDLGGFRALLGE